MQEKKLNVLEAEFVAGRRGLAPCLSASLVGEGVRRLDEQLIGRVM
jgi:hypothetical protein